MPRFNRLLLPSSVVLLSTREELPDGSCRGWLDPDPSYLTLLMAELIPIGGVAVAIDPTQRYYRHVGELPKRYQRYLAMVDKRALSLKRTHSFMKPIVDEFGVETDFLAYSQGTSSASVDVMVSVIVVADGFRRFILAQRERLQLGLDVEGLRSALDALIGVAEHPDSRLNLITFRAILRTYEQTDFETVQFRSVADEELVQHTTSIINHASYRLLSQHSNQLGIHGHIEYSRAQISAIAREITRSRVFLPLVELVSQLILVPRGIPKVETKPEWLDVRSGYLPPILNTSEPMRNALATWKRMNPGVRALLPAPDERVHVNRV